MALEQMVEVVGLHNHVVELQEAQPLLHPLLIDAMKCIRMLTFLPLEQIDEMDDWTGSQLNQAKEVLPFFPS